MYALPTVSAVLMIALCGTAQIKSLLDNLEDGHYVCAKDFDEDETMAEFRNALPDASAKVESYLGLKLSDNDDIKRFEINSLNPERTSMYVNVTEKTSGKNHFLRLDLLASNLWRAHRISQEEFKKWETACPL
ncbi:unnamed protein product [Cylicostephanus goldi]|uniref:Uncharacterized protein n=1 Tax=Cylicostephanus goldi TaxID=71465 RepID=A0A3P6R263_CYLGO|nr:unnamed protein product [Cylicostephanus goldi]